MGLKFHDISSSVSGEVNPKILPEMDAVQPRAPKYARAVFSPGFTNVRIKSINGHAHSPRLVEQTGQ